MPRTTNTRHEIVTEAMRLFAEKGFERTTIADIQSAVGISPTSGALYRRFPTKEAVLRAGIDRQLERLACFAAEAAQAPLPADALTTLTGVARFILDELRQERDLMRLIVREGDQFPGLIDQIREQIVAGTYRAFERVLTAAIEAGTLRPHDVPAVAAVAVAALVHFRMDEAVLAITPGLVPEDRFLAAWVDLMMGLVSD